MLTECLSYALPFQLTDDGYLNIFANSGKLEQVGNKQLTVSTLSSGQLEIDIYVGEPGRPAYSSQRYFSIL